MHTPARPPNRLAHASSPYLLQHAHNPVDWFPWGHEAFDEARRRGVPIFLSIGYSTCYWCHVMERECFENEAIAEQLRRDFVAIKLDREERPDLDDLYMAALLVTRGSGGWPLSVFLEPANLRPFWCGTYLPPVPSRGMASFPQILEGIAEAWRDRRGDVLEQAEAIAGAVRERLDAPRMLAAIGAGQISQSIQALLSMLDRTNGGFGGGQQGPKFPQPAYLEFLLDALPAAADDATRRGIEHALRLSLDRMAQGGLFDQLAGGFHRYSVDATWTVPHFEKMLYDNALLAIAYARASRALCDPWYATIARRTLDYVLHEMAIGDDQRNLADRTDAATATLRFASAQDAEVDGREGANYLWTHDQVRAAIPDATDAAFALEHYGLEPRSQPGVNPIKPVGNFVDPHHPPAPGAPPTYVLTLAAREDERDPRLRRVHEQLLDARSRRKQPRRDDKQITEWNGMMIAALAIAARELHEPRYAQAAARAARSLREATANAGELPRSVRDGRFSHPAVLSDYAWAILASVETARSVADANLTERNTCLAFASELADRAATLFSQSEPSPQPAASGAAGASVSMPPRWFDARADATDLFARTLATYDGATPSGVGVMLHALLELANLHPDAATRSRSTHRALDLLASLSPLIADNPIAVINATRALLRLLLSGGDLARGLHERLPARSALHGTWPPHSPHTPSGPETFTPVEIFADVDRVTLTRDQPVKFRLFIRIAPGYHIIAAEPHATPPTPEQRPGLMPLRVGLIPGSGRGVRVYADYPPGQPYSASALSSGDDTILVHQGEIEFDVVIECVSSNPTPDRSTSTPTPSRIQGRPILGVTLQACTDTECLLPRTYELDIAVDEG